MSGDPRRHTDVLMMFALGGAVDLDRVCLAVAELVRRDAAHARLVDAAEALWARYSADTATMEEPLQEAWSELSSALCEGARGEDAEEVDELEEILARTSELRADPGARMSAPPTPTRAEWALTAAIVLGSLLAAWSMGAPAGSAPPPWTFTGGAPR